MYFWSASYSASCCADLSAHQHFRTNGCWCSRPTDAASLSHWLIQHFRPISRRAGAKHEQPTTASKTFSSIDCCVWLTAYLLRMVDSVSSCWRVSSKLTRLFSKHGVEPCRFWCRCAHRSLDMARVECD